MGMASLGRASVGYLYMIELTPTKQQAIIGTFLQVMNTCVTIFSCIYFYFISKQWQWFILVGFTLSAITPVLTKLFLPESPKYLQSKGKWDELRAAMSVIARVNSRERFTGKFDREGMGRSVLNDTEIENTQRLTDVNMAENRKSSKL